MLFVTTIGRPECWWLGELSENESENFRQQPTAAITTSSTTNHNHHHHLPRRARAHISHASHCSVRSLSFVRFFFFLLSVHEQNVLVVFGAFAAAARFLCCCCILLAVQYIVVISNFSPNQIHIYTNVCVVYGFFRQTGNCLVRNCSMAVCGIVRCVVCQQDACCAWISGKMYYLNC